MDTSFDLNQHPIVAFVPTVQADRARSFYGASLGLRLLSDELPFALVYDAHGIMLRVTVVADRSPAPYTVLGWEVPDIRQAVMSLTERGIRFEQFPQLTQDDLAIWTAPGGAQIAWFRDPDGNTLSLSQHEKKPY
jgi:catechol 2,3-dioxygenase-like lactoylglutathione lyase family enzyme